VHCLDARDIGFADRPPARFGLELLVVGAEPAHSAQHVLPEQKVSFDHATGVDDAGKATLQLAGDRKGRGRMGHSSVRVIQDTCVHVSSDVYDRFYDATQ
jgi:hypothetical protein